MDKKNLFTIFFSQAYPGGAIKIFSLAAFFLFLLAGCMGNTIVKIPEMSTVKSQAVLEDMKDKRVIFIGEVHDETEHHRIQLRLIEALQKAGVRFSIGLEMFRADSQDDLDKWVSGKSTKDDFIKAYYRNWHVPWRQYRGIFLYARDNKIPLVGLNTSWEIIHQVVKGGAKSLEPEHAQGLQDVRCDVDKAYEMLIRDAMGEHGHPAGDKDMDTGADKIKDAAYNNFCEAQIVWDTAMAGNTVRYLKANPGRSIVVLAGGAHAWKRGILRIMLRDASMRDINYLVIMPEVPGKLDRENIAAGDADYLFQDP